MRLPFTTKAEDKIEHGALEVIEGEAVQDKNDVAVQTQIISEAKAIDKTHHFDPNLSEDVVEALQEAARNNSIEKAIEVEKTFLEDSPYESVRAAVRNTDGDEVANTLRAWILGRSFTERTASCRPVFYADISRLSRVPLRHCGRCYQHVS